MLTENQKNDLKVVSSGCAEIEYVYTTVDLMLAQARAEGRREAFEKFCPHCKICSLNIGNKPDIKDCPLLAVK